jgi:predicted TIM-barrel fold metal-dependent hydrolase
VIFSHKCPDDVRLRQDSGQTLNSFSACNSQPFRHPQSLFTVIDTNCYLFQWPFRHIRLDATEQLIDALRELGVHSAWAGGFHGLFYRDMRSANTLLFEECRRVGDGFLIPFGAIDPTLPDWQEDLRRCHEDFRMPGIRIYPGYHGYELAAAECRELFSMAAERKLIVQLVIAMEDERTQHRLHRIPPVSVESLPELLEQVPDVLLHIVNGLRSIPLNTAAKLRNAGKVWYEIATLEGIEGVARLTQAVSADRILLGTHAPLFYPASATLKLQESGMPEEVLEQIRHRNASALLAAAGHTAGKAD